MRLVETKNVKTYVVELTEDDLVRIWELSYRFEGGSVFPIYGRLYQKANEIEPYLAARQFLELRLRDEDMKRRYSATPL